MDPITIALIIAGITAATGAAKTATGAVQMKKANKVLKSDMPKYSRPEEYDKLLSIYQKQANMGELPGQQRYESKISERTARGVRSAAKYADSPVAAVAAANQLYGQEQSAIRDLGLQFAAYQQQAQRNLAGAYKTGADYADKEWYYNEMYPDQVKRNMAAQRWNAGQQNLWGGIDQMAGAGIQAVGAFGLPPGASNMGGPNGLEAGIPTALAASAPGLGQIDANNHLRSMTGTTSGGIYWPNLNQIPNNG